MILCPNCRKTIGQLYTSCSSCSWEFTMKEGLPIYFSTADQNDELFKRYLTNYTEISEDDLKESIQDEAYLQSQNEKLFSYLPPLKGLQVCEIGIGKGLLLDHILKQQPAKLVGVDISIPYMKKIKDRHGSELELIIANAENLPFENAFDVIIAADIIEHVFNVGDFLTCINKALKKGGKFIVKTPYNEDINIYSKLRGCKYNFVHLRNFNKKTLTKVLEGAGFQINKIIYDGFYPFMKRDYIRKYDFINKRCDNYFNKNFSNIHEVNKINNFLGRLLMNPIEMTALTIKEKEYDV